MLSSGNFKMKIGFVSLEFTGEVKIEDINTGGICVKVTFKYRELEEIKSARKRLWRDKEEPSPSSEEYQHFHIGWKRKHQPRRSGNHSQWGQRRVRENNNHGNKKGKCFKKEEIVNIPLRCWEFKLGKDRARPLDLVTLELISNRQNRVQATDTVRSWTWLGWREVGKWRDRNNVDGSFEKLR